MILRNVILFDKGFLIEHVRRYRSVLNFFIVLMNGSSNRTSNELSSEHRTLSNELRIIPLFQDDILAGLLPNILELNILRHYHKIMRGVIDKLDRGVYHHVFLEVLKESTLLVSGQRINRPLVVLHFWWHFTFDTVIKKLYHMM